MAIPRHETKHFLPIQNNKKILEAVFSDWQLFILFI